MNPSSWWQHLVLVAAGGALGATGRFMLSGWLARASAGFPWGTLVANLLGSFLAGIVFAWLEGRGASASLWRAFLMVGVLGGLTTFSALLVEAWLLRSEGPSWALAYVLTSLVAGLGLLWLGLQLGAVPQR